MATEDKDLQKIIDQYVYGEAGAELLVDANTCLGALADFVFDIHTRKTGYQILAPPLVMGYDSPHGFMLHDWLHQKDKEHNRLVLRSVSGIIYIIRDIKTPSAEHDSAFYPIDEQNKELLRLVLTKYVRTT